tara:strand:- start:1213 stop:1455 length:243 start_codon:yes stop_codon:yes gene_type:complete
MTVPPVDKKGQWLARVFLLAFLWFLYDMLYMGEFSYHSMGNKKVVSADSQPLKFYFSVFWCSLMVCVCSVFGLVAKRHDL